MLDLFLRHKLQIFSYSFHLFFYFAYGGFCHAHFLKCSLTYVLVFNPFWGFLLYLGLFHFKMKDYSATISSNTVIVSFFISKSMIHLEFYHTCRLWNRSQISGNSDIFPTPNNYWVTHISPLVCNPTFTIMLNVRVYLSPWALVLSHGSLVSVRAHAVLFGLLPLPGPLIMSTDFDSSNYASWVFLVILIIYFYFSCTAFSASPKTLCDSSQDLLILGLASGKEPSPPISLSSAPWGSSHPCDAFK